MSHNAFASSKTTLINGYSRNIENIIKKIIPSTVIQTIIQFYTIKILLFHELEFEYSKNDKSKANKYISEYRYPLHQKTSRYIRLNAIGFKNGFDLFLLLRSLYTRWKINAYIKNENNSYIFHDCENEWIESSNYLSNIKQKFKRLIVDKLIDQRDRAISLHSRIAYDDSLSVFIKIMKCTANMIYNLLNKNYNYYPFQIDLWIIPKGVCNTPPRGCYYDIDYDSDYAEEQRNKNIDIDSLLKLDKIKYEKFSLDWNKSEEKLISIIQLNTEKILKEYKHSTRIIIIVDRKNMENNKCNLYIYKPLKYVRTVVGDINNEFSGFGLERSMINNSCSYICPNPYLRGCYCGANNSLNGFMFMLSFQIHERNKIVCYSFDFGAYHRCWNWSDYLYLYLPIHFTKNDLNQNDNTKNIEKEFKLDLSDALLDKWYETINSQ